jgi:uncharacterized protein (DUF305 family)
MKRGAKYAGLIVIAAAIVAGSSCAGSPSDESAEAGFARDMATHHAQAAEMGYIVRDASTDEHVRTLAYDIIVTQSAQRGIFMAWLQQWGLPQSAPGPRMAWMEHPTMSSGGSNEGALMPGMATATEMDNLRRARGLEAEVLFLQLMIRHHEGGVMMTKALLERSRREDVLAVVRGIDSGQTAEITLMSDMLKERGAEPLLALRPEHGH